MIWPFQTFQPSKPSNHSGVCLENPFDSFNSNHFKHSRKLKKPCKLSTIDSRIFVSLFQTLWEAYNLSNFQIISAILPAVVVVFPKLLLLLQQQLRNQNKDRCYYATIINFALIFAVSLLASAKPSSSYLIHTEWNGEKVWNGWKVWEESKQMHSKKCDLFNSYYKTCCRKSYFLIFYVCQNPWLAHVLTLSKTWNQLVCKLFFYKID